MATKSFRLIHLNAEEEEVVSGIYSSLIDIAIGLEEGCQSPTCLTDWNIQPVNGQPVLAFASTNTMTGAVNKTIVVEV